MINEVSIENIIQNLLIIAFVGSAIVLVSVKFEFFQLQSSYTYLQLSMMYIFIMSTLFAIMIMKSKKYHELVKLILVGILSFVLYLASVLSSIHQGVILSSVVSNILSVSAIIYTLIVPLILLESKRYTKVILGIILFTAALVVSISLFAPRSSACPPGEITSDCSLNNYEF